MAMPNKYFFLKKIYLKSFQKRFVIEQDDLWRALTEAAHLSRSLGHSQTVKEIMDTWTLQVFLYARESIKGDPPRVQKGLT